MEHKMTILIVDDEPAHAELISRSLNNHRTRFAVEIKNSLKEASIYLAEHRPDMILCDWMLPDGKGTELIYYEEVYNQFPVVLMTSHGNEELAVEAIKSGALDYVVKSPETFANMPNFLLRAAREWKHILARRQAEQRLQRILLQTVESLALMVEKRDPYTSGHQKKVCQLSCAIAREMQLDNETTQGIYIASILHDIGKVSIPGEYLSRPGKLDPIEFTIIKTHPQVAYDMLKAIEFPSPVAQIILQHHEKCDGSGYPFGLKKNDLLLESRIITVADVVEAISSHRPYRPSLGIDAALHEIKSNAGTLYDSDVVQTCLWLFNTGSFWFES
ncbi:response regulator [Syntrophomonas palmitatica]|uniref:response regulator n=1 Tax=Syntrophomonas palmitatica TaxID=402877 RepID=UPI0006D21027|nr:HD domain-containing phosphohydrolase [Syntrophomonas palmitatica]